MAISCARQSLLLTTAAAFLVAVSVTPGCHAAQQPASGTSSAAPAVQLQPYTASDQSASAGVPQGWKVTNGQQTMITMTGPQGETVTLGNTIVAQNAAFQPGQRGANGIDLSMPYSATLAQKLAMIIQQNAVVAGKPNPQITINSATPVQLPAALGQCGRFVASLTGAQGPDKIMAVLCSLPPDTRGAYKNIFVMAIAPAAVAAQSAPIAQAIFRSYNIPGPWLQKKLGPVNAPPPPARAASSGSANPNAEADELNRETAAGIAGVDNSTLCVSLALRSTPPRETPKSCGGTKPD
ncbi:MAG: hypothetical protein ABR987_23215 [Terracidiphilus sp.]